MSDHKSKIIHEDEQNREALSAWERWQLPNMTADMPRRENALSSNKSSRVNSGPGATLETEEEKRLKPLTAKDIEAIRKAAFEEGFEEGRVAGKEAGFKEGYDTGESEVKAVVTRLSQITRALLEPIPQNDNELEKALLELVEKICKRIVHRELILNSEAILEVVHEAIDCLNPGAQRMKIHLNQQDADLVLEHLKNDGEWEESWRIQAHPTITPGGCIIETEHSTIDARAERRLAAVIQQVYERKRSEQRSGESQGQIDQLIGEVDSFDIDESDPEPKIDLEQIHGSEPKD